MAEVVNKMLENHNFKIPSPLFQKVQMPSSHLEIYATKEELIALQDPTRVRIMHFLQDSEKDFNEIAIYIAKAKSTVSSHLETLEEDGLIASRKDPDDARKKLYRTNAKLIGMSSKNKPAVYVLDREYFQNI